MPPLATSTPANPRKSQEAFERPPIPNFPPPPPPSSTRSRKRARESAEPQPNYSFDNDDDEPNYVVYPSDDDEADDAGAAVADHSEYEEGGGDEDELALSEAGTDTTERPKQPARKKARRSLNAVDASYKDSGASEEENSEADDDEDEGMEDADADADAKTAAAAKKKGRKGNDWRKDVYKPGMTPSSDRDEDLDEFSPRNKRKGGGKGRARKSTSLNANRRTTAATKAQQQKATTSAEKDKEPAKTARRSKSSTDLHPFPSRRSIEMSQAAAAELQSQMSAAAASRNSAAMESNPNAHVNSGEPSPRKSKFVEGSMGDRTTRPGGVPPFKNFMPIGPDQVMDNGEGPSNLGQFSDGYANFSPDMFTNGPRYKVGMPPPKVPNTEPVAQSTPPPPAKSRFTLSGIFTPLLSGFKNAWQAAKSEMEQKEREKEVARRKAKHLKELKERGEIAYQQMKDGRAPNMYFKDQMGEVDEDGNIGLALTADEAVSRSRQASRDGQQSSHPQYYETRIQGLSHAALRDSNEYHASNPNLGFPLSPRSSLDTSHNGTSASSSLTSLNAPPHMQYRQYTPATMITEESEGERTPRLRSKSPARKPLTKAQVKQQEKLRKQVSNLESKLEEARKKLYEVDCDDTEVPPVPPVPTFDYDEDHGNKSSNEFAGPDAEEVKRMLKVANNKGGKNSLMGSLRGKSRSRSRSRSPLKNVFQPKSRETSAEPTKAGKGAGGGKKKAGEAAASATVDGGGKITKKTASQTGSVRGRGKLRKTPEIKS